MRISWRVGCNGGDNEISIVKELNKTTYKCLHMANVVMFLNDTLCSTTACHYGSTILGQRRTIYPLKVLTYCSSLKF